MSGDLAVAVAVSLVSALAYAAAAVAQERLAARTAADASRGLVRLVTAGAWWGAVGLNAAGALLHVVALRFGPLTLVQPLGAFTLVAAVPLGARYAGRRVARLEWRGALLTLGGLGLLMYAASGPAPEDSLTLTEALAVGAATLLLIGALGRRGRAPGLRHATASGIASGIASALTQTATVALAAPGKAAPPVLQTVLVALLVAAFASAGLLLAQTAYRSGLGAPLAVVTLTNPLAASVVGLTLLGERLHGGAAGILPALAGALVAGAGVAALSRAAARGAREPREPEPQAGPVEVLAPGVSARPT
ncbi:DMT family transporter [Streptomyces sp. BI87]|uniref:DMT family transporter n=1 Tax=Streptomyces sp. BI87 TaxID=2987521 RepID=UPI002221419C|nr:DMT family transporter [Streptomyces sp. BI87]UYX92668.1 DMT family transporter [Streptomyces sp. BI87]